MTLYTMIEDTIKNDAGVTQSVFHMNCDDPLKIVVVTVNCFRDAYVAGYVWRQPRAGFYAEREGQKTFSFGANAATDMAEYATTLITQEVKP